MSLNEINSSHPDYRLKINTQSNNHQFDVPSGPNPGAEPGFPIGGRQPHWGALIGFRWRGTPPGPANATQQVILDPRYPYQSI